MYYNKLTYILIAILSLSSLSTVALSNTNNTVDEPRWFEIEVIVYKQTNNQGLLDEKWDPDLAMTKSDNLIDFLQPYLVSSELYEGGVIPIDTEENDKSVEEPSTGSLAASEIESIVDTDNPATSQNPSQDTSIKTPIDNSVTDIHSLDEEAQLLAQLNEVVEEKPFQSLSNELLQLKDVLASLKRHPDYKLLTHVSWRQPVLGKNDAVHVRIAGGQDFSQNYDYQGNQLISEIETNEVIPDVNTMETNISDVFTSENETFDSVETIDTSLATPSLVEELSEQSLNTHDNPPLLNPITAQVWVPELDGDIKVYLKQFLHINTNLFLRRPDKQEVDAIELDNYNPELLSVFNTQPLNATLSSAEEPSNLASFDSLSPLQTNETVIQSSDIEQQHQFSWDIEEDFLERGSQKIYIEKLFNYPLKQSRRVRSGELHFFDHPLLGMLIMIRPYERQQQVISEELSPGH